MAPRAETFNFSPQCLQRTGTRDGVQTCDGDLITRAYAMNAISKPYNGRIQAVSREQTLDTPYLPYFVTHILSIGLFLSGILGNKSHRHSEFCDLSL